MMNVLSEEEKIHKLIDLFDLKEGETAKEKIIEFVHRLKEIGSEKTYRSYSYRTFHFDYVVYLVSLEKHLRNKDYEKVVNLLRYIVIEEGDYIRQPRFYDSLIHILEEIERNEIYE